MHNKRKHDRVLSRGINSIQLQVATWIIVNLVSA